MITMSFIIPRSAKSRRVRVRVGSAGMMYKGSISVGDQHMSGPHRQISSRG
jgi:hypothetical protein